MLVQLTSLRQGIPSLFIQAQSPHLQKPPKPRVWNILAYLTYIHHHERVRCNGPTREIAQSPSSPSSLSPSPQDYAASLNLIQAPPGDPQLQGRPPDIYTRTTSLAATHCVTSFRSIGQCTSPPSAVRTVGSARARCNIPGLKNVVAPGVRRQDQDRHQRRCGPQTSCRARLLFPWEVDV